jgi:hypothetical protein
MTRLLRILPFLLLLLALDGCAAPPPFPAVASLIPPLGPGQARIYFYRDWEVSERISIAPRIYLTGVPTGDAFPGGVFYRDVPAPETYYISVDTKGYYWYPFKEVALKAGETLFVKIESLASWGSGRSYPGETFVVAIIDPAQAEAELQGMRYTEREVAQ